ncbi:MAG: Gfo/Idh/MocA family protein [Sedimentitalea sp.]
MIRVACVGAGYFSQFHLDGWARLPGATLVGICDRDPQAATKTGLAVFTDLEQMLNDTRPEILDLIIPPAGHADAIRTALDTSDTLRAIICQKPFCTSLEEARDITALAEAADIPLIVHENFRFQPWYRVIRDQIAAGAIGTPLQATFRLRPGDGQGADAYQARQPYFQQMERFLIHETGVHWIDTFRFLFGDPLSVYADLRRVNPVIAGEDAGFVLFDHPNGVRVLLDGNRSLDHDAQNTRCTMGEGLFEGPAGTLTLSGDGAVHLRAFASQTQTCVLGPDTSQTFGGDCTHHLQAHVIAALENGTALENPARDYLTVVRIENAIYHSAQSQRKIQLSP